MLSTVRDLGAALQRRRVELGLSQEQLCRKAGVARSWLSKLETGKHPGAEVQKVLDVAAALDLSLTLVPTPSIPRGHDPGDDPFSELFDGRP
jgi:transcriptional regulator with XRE-family HTH domain